MPTITFPDGDEWITVSLSAKRGKGSRLKRDCIHCIGGWVPVDCRNSLQLT